MDLIASELDVEMPGALTEIAPSPEYDPFVDFRERAMFMQAWSSYGVQWPVIHHFAGVRPDMPHHRLAVVQDVPDSWPGLSVSRLCVGNGQIRCRGQQVGQDVYHPGNCSRGLGADHRAHTACRCARPASVVGWKACFGL